MMMTWSLIPDSMASGPRDIPRVRGYLAAAEARYEMVLSRPAVPEAKAEAGTEVTVAAGRALEAAIASASEGMAGAVVAIATDVLSSEPPAVPAEPVTQSAELAVSSAVERAGSSSKPRSRPWGRLQLSRSPQWLLKLI